MGFSVSDILARLRGFSTPIGGVSWAAGPSERDAANRLMVFLYDRRVLYVPSEVEVPRHVVQSVLEIRRKIADIAETLPSNCELELKLRAMRSACVHFLNRVGRDEDIVAFGSARGHWASWEFIDAVGQWRAFMAIYIGMIAGLYSIEPPAFLRSVLPADPFLAPDEDIISKNRKNTQEMIEELEALPREELERQIAACNAFLDSGEGRAEFGLSPKPRIESSMDQSVVEVDRHG